MYDSIQTKPTQGEVADGDGSYCAHLTAAGHRARVRLLSGVRANVPGQRGLRLEALLAPLVGAQERPHLAVHHHVPPQPALVFKRTPTPEPPQ